jgi:hypothetical protein
MKKPLHEVITFIENYNHWRRGSYLHEQPVPEELGQCLDQAVEMLKAMTWQPMETAPKDREFLAVWGPKDPPPGEAFDVFRYDEDKQKIAFSSHGAVIFLPSDTYGPWAWMEIPKYNP